MADSAKVLSVDALKEFRLALIKFVEECEECAQRGGHGAAADPRLARSGTRWRTGRCR